MDVLAEGGTVFILERMEKVEDFAMGWDRICSGPTTN